MTNVDDILFAESTAMGQTVIYRNAFETTFFRDGIEREFMLVLYDVGSYQVAGVQMPPQTRFVIYIDGRLSQGGIV